MLPGPGRQTNEPFFGSRFFLETRLSSESLEGLIGLPEYHEPKLWLKKQEVGKNSKPTEGNHGHNSSAV